MSSILISDNLVSWEKYERERDGLADKLAAADTELVDTKKVFNMEMAPKDHADRMKTAATMRKGIEDSFNAMVKANETLNQLLEDDMKMELGEQVKHSKYIIFRNVYILDYKIRIIYIHKFIHIQDKNARQKCTSCINTFLTRRDKLSIKMISR